MLKSISGVTTFPIDSPTKTSAPTMASSRVVRSRSVVNSFFFGCQILPICAEDALAVTHDDVLFSNSQLHIESGARNSRGTGTIDHYSDFLSFLACNLQAHF